MLLKRKTVSEHRHSVLISNGKGRSLTLRRRRTRESDVMTDIVVKNDREFTRSVHRVRYDGTVEERLKGCKIANNVTLTTHRSHDNGSEKYTLECKLDDSNYLSIDSIYYTENEKIFRIDVDELYDGYRAFVIHYKDDQIFTYLLDLDDVYTSKLEVSNIGPLGEEHRVKIYDALSHIKSNAIWGWDSNGQSFEFGDILLEPEEIVARKLRGDHIPEHNSQPEYYTDLYIRKYKFISGQKLKTRTYNKINLVRYLEDDDETKETTGAPSTI